MNQIKILIKMKQMTIYDVLNDPESVRLYIAFPRAAADIISIRGLIPCNDWGTNLYYDKTHAIAEALEKYEEGMNIIICRIDPIALNLSIDDWADAIDPEDSYTGINVAKRIISPEFILMEEEVILFKSLLDDKKQYNIYETYCHVTD